MKAKSSELQFLSFEADTQTRLTYNHSFTSKGRTSKSEGVSVQTSPHFEQCGL
jgi:hypothetical protein